jgi:hypothetical protein
MPDRINGFDFRPFEMPVDFMLEARKQANHKGPNLTALLSAYAGNMGDYSRIHGWRQALSREFNWTGNTIPFYVIAHYHDKYWIDGNPRYLQTILENQYGPQAYLRTLHLSRASRNRPADCTKIEETLVASPEDILRSTSKNTEIHQTSALRALYDCAAAQCYEYGHARIMTELAVGMPYYGGYSAKARKIAQTLEKGITDKKNAHETKRAATILLADWADITARFAHNMGFTISDLNIPEDGPVCSKTPQMRIYRRVREDARPLGEPLFSGRQGWPCRSEADLAKLRDFVTAAQARAMGRYGLTRERVQGIREQLKAGQAHLTTHVPAE